MTLDKFIEENGYLQIPLTVSGVGHFHAEGRLEEQRLTVLVDTGAASTVLSLNKVRQMNLMLKKLSISGGGAGAARMEIYQISDAIFRFVNFSPKTNGLLAMDLSHVNQALTLKGSSPVDAILGVDVLHAHQAVIDYGGRSLYMKR